MSKPSKNKVHTVKDDDEVREGTWNRSTTKKGTKTRHHGVKAPYEPYPTNRMRPPTPLPMVDIVQDDLDYTIPDDNEVRRSYGKVHNFLLGSCAINR
jgi:hypothetical protein